MFEQATLDGVRKSSPWSFAASITVQSVLVAAALALPLMRVSRMETRPPDIFFLPHSIGAVDPVTQPPRTSSSNAPATETSKIYRPFQSPSAISARVATGPESPGAPEYAFGDPPAVGFRDGMAIGALPDLGQKLLTLPPPEPPHQAEHESAQPAAVRVGGGVQSAKLVLCPRPVYPALAKQARISGTVQLAARISADGRIRDLRVMSGHPMLVSAALDAVRQWVYKPTLLNGQPVEVITDIVVNFVLNQ